jgi:hypothetical protein
MPPQPTTIELPDGPAYVRLSVDTLGKLASLESKFGALARVSRSGLVNFIVARAMDDPFLEADLQRSLMTTSSGNA